MTTRAMRILPVLALISVFALAGCGPAADNGDDQPAHRGGSEFDLGDVGMRGMQWSGQAVLLENGLEFDDAEMELSTLGFTLRGNRFDLGQFDDPDLEFRGEPATMTVRLSGRIEDREPGWFSVSLNSASARFGDYRGQALGTDTAEEIRQVLEKQGIVFPEIDRDNPPVVTFEVSASDEDYTELVLTSDIDFIERIEMQGGERASM